MTVTTPDPTSPERPVSPPYVAGPAYGPPTSPFIPAGPPTIYPPPKRGGARVGLIIGAAVFGLVLFLGVGATLVAYVGHRGPFAPGGIAPGAAPAGPTIEDAQRECSTAFEAEFRKRQTSAQAGKDLLVSITDIKVDESRKTSASSYQVNGTVYFDITAALIPTVHNALRLTCTASVQNGSSLTTFVQNR